MRHACKIGLVALLLTACTRSHFPNTPQYGDDLTPLPLLQGASELATSWSIPTTGRSGSSGMNSWVTTTKFDGTFDCDSADLEALGQALLATLRDDVFGKGFQLREGSRVETGGAPNAIDLEVLFGDVRSLGTLHFTAQATKSPSFEYQLSISEETR